MTITTLEIIGFILLAFCLGAFLGAKLQYEIRQRLTEAELDKQLPRIRESENS